MVNKKLPSLLTLFLIVPASQSFGQIGWDSVAIHSKNRLFSGYTYSILPDIEKGPVKIYPNYVSDNNPTPPYPQRGEAAVFIFNTNFVSLGGKIRYNILQFSNRVSISISIAPSLGIGFTVIDEPDIYQIMPYADCSYNIPFMVEFNYGNDATHNTYDEYGIFVFGGVEYTGLFFKNTSTNSQLMDMDGHFYNPDFTDKWMEAAFGLGVRYRNKRNIEREIYLKYGIGPNVLYVSPLEKVESAHAWTLKLTLVRNF
jgi:hypothetical protein